ncbi:MAG: AMP-dependent synthetase [Acidobacteria bacterium]|nr:MAG: AMP-dependent synthetase [Acidobacteriota bacterium]
MSSSSPFVFDWLFEHAECQPHAPAVGTPAGWLSYQQLAERVRRLATAFRAAGMAAQSRVLVALANGPAAVAVSLAIQAVGACAVELDVDWGADHVAAIANQTEAEFAVILGRNALLWSQVRHTWTRLFIVHPSTQPEPPYEAPQREALAWISEDGDMPDVHADKSAVEGILDPDTPALLVYTSGSTGGPRGVIQTHKNISANTRSICQYLELGPQDRVMSILPLYYCYGKSLLQTHLCAGGSIFFDHRFTYPHVVMEAIREQRCTGFAGVPLTFELLKRLVNVTSLDLSTLRYVTQAGGGMQPETIRWAREAFAPARLYVMYGQTEATARLSYLPPECAVEKEGSIGRGIPGVELQIVDQDGVPCADGVRGQVVARGDNVTPGYFRDPEGTSEILKDGWLWTGDLGHRDADGFVFLSGRLKEILKVGGHRVSAVEIEQEICRHLDVQEAAVVGAPDDIEGEIPIAFVVARPGAVVDGPALRKFCRDRLPIYKVPKLVYFVSELPRTGAGKVSKSELREKINLG